MNRFDENFNDIDPITSRPFSWGHPDGVWIIAIIYTLIVLVSFVSVVVGIYRLFSYGLSHAFILLSGCVSLFLFSSALIFLFRRSNRAFYSAVTILIFCVINYLAAGPLGDFKLSMGSLVVLCAQSYICYYIYGLKKDNLLIGP